MSSEAYFAWIPPLARRLLERVERKISKWFTRGHVDKKYFKGKYTIENSLHLRSEGDVEMYIASPILLDHRRSILAVKGAAWSTKKGNSHELVYMNRQITLSTPSPPPEPPQRPEPPPSAPSASATATPDNPTR